MDVVNVVVELGTFPMTWILSLNRPYISIDGTAHKRSWGTQELALSAGTHVIETWWSTLLFSRCSPASRTLEVVEGTSYRLVYQPSWFRWSPGSLHLVDGPLPTARLVPP
jgi:hypothetical protein